MKRKILLCLFVIISFLASISYAYADSNIAGWWKVVVNFQEGDFITGEWTIIQTPGARNFSYLLVGLNTSSTGTAYLVEWNNGIGSYILENTYSVYTKNNIVFLTGPSSADADGNLTSASTIVLKAFPPFNIMKGYYTRYDNDVDQFVGMGSLSLTRVLLVQSIPNEVKILIPGP